MNFNDEYKTVGPNGEKYYIDEQEMAAILRPYVEQWADKEATKSYINDFIGRRAQITYDVVLEFQQSAEENFYQLLLWPQLDSNGDIIYSTVTGSKIKVIQVHDRFYDNFDKILLNFVEYKAKPEGWFGPHGELRVESATIKDQFQYYIHDIVCQKLAEQMVQINFMGDGPYGFFKVQDHVLIPGENTFTCGEGGGGGETHTITITTDNPEDCAYLDACGEFHGVAGERYGIVVKSLEGWYMDSVTITHPNGSTENVNIGGYEFSYVIPSLDGDWNFVIHVGA